MDNLEGLGTLEEFNGKVEHESTASQTLQSSHDTLDASTTEGDTTPPLTAKVLTDSISITQAEYDALKASETELLTLLRNISIINTGLSRIMERDDFLILLKTVAGEACAVVEDGLDDIGKGMAIGMDFYERRQAFFAGFGAYVAQAAPLSNFEGLDFSFLEQLDSREDVDTQHISKLIAYVSSFKPTVKAIEQKFKNKKEAGTLPTVAKLVEVAMSVGASQMMAKMNPLSWFKKQ